MRKFALLLNETVCLVGHVVLPPESLQALVIIRQTCKQILYLINGASLRMT